MWGMIRWGLAYAVLWWALPAVAQVDVTPGVMTDVKTAAQSINTQLVGPALSTAMAALTLQWIITYNKELFNGDLTSSLAKSIGLLTWLGVAITLINNQSVFGGYFDKYATLAGSLSGLDATTFSPSYLITNAVACIKATNVAFSSATDTHWWQISDNFFGAGMLIFANIFTFIAFLIIALSVFVAQLEFWIMYSVAPLAFGLIPLAAFRDQGIAPIKGLMSLGLRIIILGVIVSVANKMTQTLITQLNNVGLSNGDSVFDPVWYYLAGMAGCAMMALSAGKIASSIASGSASFSGADAIRGGMQMASTAAVGTAGVAGVSALMAGAAQPALAGFHGGTPGNGAFDAGQRMAQSLMGTNGHMSVAPGGGSGAGTSGGLGAPLASAPSGGAAPSGGSSAEPTGGSAPGHAVAAGARSHAMPSGGSAPAVDGGLGGGLSGGDGAAPAASASPSGSSPSAPSGGTTPSGAAAPSGQMAGDAGRSEAGQLGGSLGGEPSPGAMGDASTASIGGAPAGAGAGMSADQKTMQQIADSLNRKPSAGERLGQATRSAAEHHTQDQHTVSVNVSTRGE